MELNKWEEEFKNKLEQREISPTPHAWQRLDAMLNDAENRESAPIALTPKTRIKKLQWIYLAAGIAAFLLIATVFFTQNRDEQRNEIVVKETVEPAKHDLRAPEIGTEQNQSHTKVADNNTIGGKSARNKLPSSVRRQDDRLPGNVSPQNNTRLAEVEPENINTVRHPSSNQQQPTANTQPPATKSPNQQLASAEQKIPAPKGIKVDARSLLSQVDGELDMTFREKTIKSISRKYQNVKVALANRNTQE